MWFSGHFDGGIPFGLHNQGVPVPAAASISRVDVGNVRWILVVEKDVRQIGLLFSHN